MMGWWRVIFFDGATQNGVVKVWSSLVRADYWRRISTLATKRPMLRYTGGHPLAIERPHCAEIASRQPERRGFIGG